MTTTPPPEPHHPGDTGSSSAGPRAARRIRPSTDRGTQGRAELDPEPPTARIVRDEHTLITRAELGRMTGLSESGLAAQYSRRDVSGHPAAVDRNGRWLYFDEAAALAWHSARGVHKKSTLTEVDRTGDPDGRVEAARILGYSNPKVIDSYRARNKGYFPEPDDTKPLRWRRATLWAFADRRSRPGRAGHRAPPEQEGRPGFAP